MSLLSRVLRLLRLVLPVTLAAKVKLGNEVLASHGFQELQGQRIGQALALLKNTGRGSGQN
jgi:hypothetical protein